MSEEQISAAQEYGADQIQILEGLEAVRKRPGMYIGSTSSKGLHHLVYEIVDNAVDEALAGFCDTVKVYINEDNSITVRDNGRGIPVGINKKKGIPAVEVVFTILHAGGKFGGGGYKVSGGLHGVGASVVNALSTWLEVDIFHEGKIYRQRYERGKVMYPLKIVGDTDKRGTEVRFLPDPTIFEETVFDFSVLKQRLREMAFLTKGLKIVLKDKRPEENVALTFHYEGGIREYVEYLNKSKEVLYPQVIYCEGKKGDVVVEVALQHNDSYNEGVYSFVNNITTPEGGTHLAGFRSALTKTFNDYARKNNKCAAAFFGTGHEGEAARAPATDGKHYAQSGVPIAELRDEIEMCHLVQIQKAVFADETERKVHVGELLYIFACNFRQTVVDGVADRIILHENSSEKLIGKRFSF